MPYLVELYSIVYAIRVFFRTAARAAELRRYANRYNGTANSRKQDFQIHFFHRVVLFLLCRRAPKTGWFENNGCYSHTKKARESVPVARPTLRGLRIAQSDRTSNAEAHADMQSATLRTACIQCVFGHDIYISHGRLPLPCSRTDFEVCEVPKCQEQSAV